MRKIDKTEVLALQYKDWENSIAEVAHPKYNSSKGKFYYDIISNLIWIQKGLCAYTEFFLQNDEPCNPENWDNGCFHPFEFGGELDHYDPALKTNKSWLWDNFFLIDADINSKKVKGSLVPRGILKPDKIDFDPYYYLEYDVANHIFMPSLKRTSEEREDIKYDIKVLGLNWEPIRGRREKYLSGIINDVRYGLNSYENAAATLYQFFTAFELCKNYMIG